MNSEFGAGKQVGWRIFGIAIFAEGCYPVAGIFFVPDFRILFDLRQFFWRTGGQVHVVEEKPNFEAWIA